MRIIYVVFLLTSARCALPHPSSPDAHLGVARPVPEYVEPADAADQAPQDAAFIILPWGGDATAAADAADAAREPADDVADVASAMDAPDAAPETAPDSAEPDAGHCTPTTCNPAGDWTCFELMEGGVACGGVGSHVSPCMDRLNSQCPDWFPCREDVDGQWQCMLDPARTWPPQ